MNITNHDWLLSNIPFSLWWVMLFYVFKKVVSMVNNERKGCETLGKYVEGSGGSDIARTGEQFSWQFGLAVRQRRPVDWTNLSCLARLPSNPLYTPFIPFSRPSRLTPVRLCLSSSYLALLLSVFIIPSSPLPTILLVSEAYVLFRVNLRIRTPSPGATATYTTHVLRVSKQLEATHTHSTSTAD